MTNPDADFWRNKKVLITGHTGFKGGWLIIWLRSLGAQVSGVSLAPHTRPSLFLEAGLEKLCAAHYICDIRDEQRLSEIVHEVAPDIVFHLAAQSLVRLSYRNPSETFATNFMGTVHLLDALTRACSTRVAVMVTTDKVYENREWHWPYREIDSLGGHDPYSASKAACEIAIKSYGDAFLLEGGISWSSVRAGNVIGGGDWSEDRLIPDVIRAWEKGVELKVRRPRAVRPWQHVLEPLSGYLVLAERLWDTPKLSGSFNFGPSEGGTASVRQVVDVARNQIDELKVTYEAGETGPTESNHLTLDISKARNTLEYIPRWGLEGSIRRTISWYEKLSSGQDALELCHDDIKNFCRS